MVLSEAEKKQRADQEKAALARKKAEKERVLAESRADRELYNARKSKVKEEAVLQQPRLLIRVRYNVDGQKGRRPVEVLGSTDTISYFQFLQAVEETFEVPVNRQVLRLADEATFPIEPCEEALPSFDSFSSVDDFPSLEELGLRNGQEIFLSVAPEAAGVAPSAPASAPSRGGEASQASSLPSAAAVPSAAEPASPAVPQQSVAAAIPTPPAAPTQQLPVDTTDPVLPAQPERPVPPVPSVQPAKPVAPAAVAPGMRVSDENRLKFLWRTIETQKLNLTRARDARAAAEVERVRRDPETERLRNLLLWQPEQLSKGPAVNPQLEFYARLKADLDRTVGLEPVKEFIVQRLRDAAGRHVLMEGKQPRRHVLISGAFGTGKRYAADLIARLFSLLNTQSRQLGGAVRLNSRVRLAAWQDEKNRGVLMSKNDVGVVVEVFPMGTHEPFRVQGPSGRSGNFREDELVAEQEHVLTLGSLADLVDPKSGQLRASERTCYYLRLTGVLAETDATILESVLEKGSVVVMAGSPDVVEANMQLSAFRRRQPDMLVLPTLTPTDVARLIAMEVERRGYAGVGEGDVGTPQLVTVLEHIIRQRFDEQLIREKNSHLAQDVLDLAITRKNDRTWGAALDCAERFRLTPTDFGLDVLTAEQRERRLEEVEAEVAELVGWGSSDDAGTPRHFFKTLRRQLTSKSGGSKGLTTAGALHLPRALWVTANPGVGRETLVRLAARFLRAAGAISREEVVWVEGSELAAASDPMDLLAVRLAAATRGCIAVRDADVLTDSREVVPGASGPLRALGSSLGGVEGGGTTLAVIIGSPSGMARIGRMEPSLEPRFPTRVAIPDLAASELVQFIEQAAGNLPSGALHLEDGLALRLSTHINETYGGGSAGKELGERGNLMLARRLLQRAVQNRLTRLFTRIQEGEEVAEGPESEQLTVADFEVGAALGEGIEEKAAIDEEVNNLIGMEKAKEWFQQVRQKVAFVEQTGTKSDLRVCLNIIITGNPGTGKTTFARLLAKFFFTYGVLEKDSFVEKNGVELKAEYMGGTAPRVKAAVQEAMGGCLFLDEAYALMDSSAGVGGSGDAFSQEALRTLLTEVENHRTNLMVVLAGYKEKMGRLMRAEEGLARRFPSRLHLDDYRPAELASICEMVARTRHQRDFEPGLQEKLATHIENFYWRDISQQNAGLSVNLTEKALDRQIVRIVNSHPQAFSIPVGRGATPSGPPPPETLLRQRSGGVSIQQVKEEVAIFTAGDFGIEERPTLGDPELRQRVQAEVDRLIGMANVKAFFKEMARTVAFVERGGDPRVLQTSLNLQLTGNPGTGKTTVARLIGRYLYAHGVLPRDTFVERNALALKGQFVGQTAPTVAEAVRDAMGGCLFIDEAYALCDRGGDKFSGEVVRTLLTEVENHRTGLLVVLAGYADKMQVLMDSDPGLRRRFSLVLTLQDYNPEELAEICESAAADRFRLSFAPGLQLALAEHIRRVHGREISQHNGGLAVTLAERAFRRLATRLGDPTGDSAVGGAASRELLPEDFGIVSNEALNDSGSGVAAGAQGQAEVVAVPNHGEAAAAPARSTKRGGEGPGGVQERRGPRPPKRGRPDWQQAVGSLARSLAAELLRGVEQAENTEDDDDEDEDMPGGDAGPRGSDSAGGGTATKAKAKARGRDKERPAEVLKEEEQVPIQEGEQVVEEMSTKEALDQLGLCPANFEWFELSITDPPHEDCGICHFRMNGGYRCGGGTHYVCLNCVDAYKTKRTD